MCGFAGFLSEHAVGEAALRTVGAMARAIRHRGPDDHGTWVDPNGGVALGHQRLSIIDVSSAGHQPMASHSGRFIIVYNGEVYNHAEIRAELERTGYAREWRGHSDTETLLAGFEAWGVDTTLDLTVGMFAIAVWDRLERRIHLIRDRFGEKPLYYGWIGKAFVFGSELKALRTFPGFCNPISPEALSQFFRLLYVPAPYSIYEGLFKLEPGCTLTIRGVPPSEPPKEPLQAGDDHGNLSVRRWWSLEEAIEIGSRSRVASDAEALELLDGRLRQAVQLQSIADVPLGAFLSGGVDSSLIAALMQQEARRTGAKPVKTFTVGFKEAGFDESPHAQAVAEHLGTDHRVLLVTEREARAVIPDLPAMFDEPFGDSSQIPTHLLCQAAQQHVTVALSGDAGDELFGGYNRYLWGPRIWDRLRAVPFGARQAMAHGVQAISPERWNRLLSFMGVLRPGEKLHKVARALKDVHTFDELYGSLVSEWTNPDLVRRTCHDKNASYGSLTRAPRLSGIALREPAAKMMFWDSMTYLPDDILCKVDRAAMAVSLETRVPFLDHRVAELAWRLPMSMKIRDGQGKWALRQILYRHVPRELIERPKSGFAVPIGEWLRGPLRPWAEDLLEENRLRRQGYLNAALVRTAWLQHISGRYDWTNRLWAVLTFQAWIDKQSTLDSRQVI